MESNELSVLFLTANQVPQKWAEYQMSTLLMASAGSPLITLSRKPVPWGINILDEEEKSIFNIYFQMLKGARLATTPYIAIAEDDVLYSSEHFAFRPSMDSFAYDMNRLNVFTWSRNPMYFFKNRVSNSMLIAPRELMIEALVERFKGTRAYKIHGELGRRNVEDRLGVTRRKRVEYFSEGTSIRFDHEAGYDHASRHHRKKEGPIKAYDIPHWGRASELIKKFI